MRFICGPLGIGVCISATTRTRFHNDQFIERHSALRVGLPLAMPLPRDSHAEMTTSSVIRVWIGFSKVAESAKHVFRLLRLKEQKKKPATNRWPLWVRKYLRWVLIDTAKKFSIGFQLNLHKPMITCGRVSCSLWLKSLTSVRSKVFYLIPSVLCSKVTLDCNPS